MTVRRYPILFIAPSRIGDSVLCSGLINELIQREPGARLTVVSSTLAARLFAHIPGLDRLIVLDKRPVGVHWLDLWLQAWREKWALVVDFRGSPISWTLRTSRRLAHTGLGLRAHRVVEAARLLGLEHAPPAPVLFTDSDTEACAEALTRGHGPILALAPTANWMGKMWPAERFILAAQTLLAKDGPLSDGRLMVLGGPADRDIVKRVQAAAARDRQIDLRGKTDLLLIFASLKRVRLFMGCDSGLMHMAAAAGAPTLGLFGPSDERHYAPWGARTLTVRGPRSYEEIRQQDPKLSSPVCHMMDLPVTTVIDAACSLLNATKPLDLGGVG
jgi:ADP-heptose:LPS heptosyltransferase